MLLSATACVAQEAAETPLTGKDLIGAYGGGNAGFIGISEGLLSGLPPEYRVTDPGGIGHQYGVVYARQMPNLFVSRPPAAGQVDPGRLYRKISTFELRVLHSRYEGSGRVRNISSPEAPRRSLSYQVDLFHLEPRFSFDILPMGRGSSPRFNIGAAFGSIARAEIMMDRTATEPAVAIEQAEFRSFYSALVLGFGYRFNIGESGYGSSMIAPDVDIVIPFTSLSEYWNWLPFALRFGVTVGVPL